MSKEDILHELSTTGLSMLEPLTLGQTSEVQAWFASRPVYANAHVPQTARNADPGARPGPWESAAASEYVCADTSDAILAPHLFERGLATIDVAAAWLGRDPPVAYSMNAFWSRPGPTVRPDIQQFHVDADDVKFLAMFFYLTDVTMDDDGPHVLQGPDGVARTTYGRAGSIFLANTMLPHMGLKPKRQRGVAWFRWGLSDRPPANVWDKIEPVQASLLGSRYPSDARLREAVKLLVV